jgi:hypothetical protein
VNQTTIFFEADMLLTGLNQFRLDVYSFDEKASLGMIIYIKYYTPTVGYNHRSDKIITVPMVVNHYYYIFRYIRVQC